MSANILSGKGANYFSQEISLRPLLHMWSLGIEEQFYLIWPTILIIVSFFGKNVTIFFTFLMLSISFFKAETSVSISPITTYFYPQYRAFELLIGAMAFFLEKSNDNDKINRIFREILFAICILLIVIPMIVLNKESNFPGFNTLYPCIGTAIFIITAKKSTVSVFFKSPLLVMIGLISYPLYLYHQPIISFIYFFEISKNNVLIFLLTMIISTPFSYITYIYIERPVRVSVKYNNMFIVHILIIALIACSCFGYYLAKSNGMPIRFKVLNNFAY